MNSGTIKYIGTIIEGYQTQKFESGETYFYKNVTPGQYGIYDKEDGTLIETIGLRSFNKCFEGLNLPKRGIPKYEHEGTFVTWEIDTEGLKIAKIEKDQKITLNELMDDLFWGDMQLADFGTGWMYITHENSDSVFYVEDYAYNNLDELNERGYALFELSPTGYEEYAEGDGDELNEGLNIPKVRIPKIGDVVKFYINGENDFTTGTISYVDKNKKSFMIVANGHRYKRLVRLRGIDQPFRAWWYDGDEPDIKTIIHEGLNLPKKYSAPVELTSDLLPIVNVCMYGTSLAADNVIRDTEMLSYKGADKYWEYFDNNLYDNFILERAKVFIKNEIADELKSAELGIMDVVVHKIVSPKYYNYGCDELYYDLIVTSTFDRLLLQDIERQDEASLQRFLHEKFKSRSGFISYMPSDIISLQAAITNPKERERGVAAYLTYKFQDNFEDWQSRFEESVYENHSDLDFLREDTPEEIINNMLEELNGNENVDWSEPDDEEVEQIQEGLNLPKKKVLPLNFDDIKEGDIITGNNDSNPFHNIPGKVGYKTNSEIQILFKGYETTPRYLAKIDFNPDDWKIITEGLNLPKRLDNKQYIVTTDYEEREEYLTSNELFDLAQSVSESLDDHDMDDIVTIDDAIDRLYLGGYRVEQLDGLQEGLNIPRKPKPENRFFELHMCFGRDEQGCYDESTLCIKIPRENIKPIPENSFEELDVDTIQPIIKYAIMMGDLGSGDEKHIDFGVEIDKETYCDARPDDCENDDPEYSDYKEYPIVNEGLNIPKKTKIFNPTEVVIYPEGEIVVLPSFIVRTLQYDDIIFFEDEQFGISDNDVWIIEYYNDYKKLPLKEKNGYYIQTGDIIEVDEPGENDAWRNGFSGAIVGFKEDWVEVEDAIGDVFAVYPEQLQLET